VRLLTPTVGRGVRLLVTCREKLQMTGTPFFVGGCGVAMALFEKRVAIASILYLIIGDMTAVSARFSPSHLFSRLFAFHSGLPKQFHRCCSTPMDTSV
jgi:hypothetical protein